MTYLDASAAERMLNDQLNARRLIKAIDEYNHNARFAEAELRAEARSIVARIDRALGNTGNA